MNDLVARVENYCYLLLLDILCCSWGVLLTKATTLICIYEIIKQVMVCVVFEYVIAKDLVICYSFFEKHSTNTDTHTRTSTHPYEHTHAHPTLMSTSERLRRLDFEIHKIGHQERLVVDGDVASH